MDSIFSELIGKRGKQREVKIFPIMVGWGDRRIVMSESLQLKVMSGEPVNTAYGKRWFYLREQIYDALNSDSEPVLIWYVDFR